MTTSLIRGTFNPYQGEGWIACAASGGLHPDTYSSNAYLRHLANLCPKYASLYFDSGNLPLRPIAPERRRLHQACDFLAFLSCILQLRFGMTTKTKANFGYR